MSEEKSQNRPPMIIPPGLKAAISAEEARGPQGPQDNYAFVVNVSRLVGATSFTLASGHELRRASPEEIAVIKATIQPYMFFSAMPWEVKLLDGGASEPLPEEDWRYHVISFQGNNVNLVEIEEACNLATPEIKIGFVVFRSLGQKEFMYPGHGLVMHQGRLFQILDRALWTLTFSDISEPDIEAIRKIHDQLRQHDHRLVDVRRLASQLQELESVPSYSALRFLGYFAVLEALLTHPPKPTDPYDSITRQIKKKVALVDHRCQPHIDYGAFAEASKEKIWSKMYEYRSSLAHGGAPAFDGDLKLLGKPENALKLVKETVKAVIRQALIEPQLLADLKDC
jgi:hypothetical protein